MTIQLIPAFDNNPPKFHRLPKPGKGFKRYVKVMGIISLILAFINGLSVPSHFFTAFMKGLGIMLLLQLPVIWVVATIFKARVAATNGLVVTTNLPIHEYYKQAFIQQGYQVDFESEGVVIDAARRKIGFTQSTTGIDPKTRLVNNMLVCDFHDVQRWYVSNTQHKTKFSGGVSAAHNSATGITTVYQSPGYERVDLSSFRIVVEINYPPFPIQDFRAKNQFDADQWVARLSSLINN